MKTKQQVLVLTTALLLLLPFHIDADYEHSCTFHEKLNNQKYFCGDNLKKMLQTICRMVGRKKRSVDRSEKVFHPKKRALAMLNKRQNEGNQGIICECCVNKCSLNEMAQYC